jgi:CHAD domain-containing protein
MMSADQPAPPAPPAPPAAPPALAPPAAAYAEHDKLGPLPTVAAIDGGALRARVLAEVTDAVASARAASKRATVDPAETVHEVRKALRRLRSLADAVAPALDRAAYHGLQRALIEARRSLGPARDRTVAHLTLTGVPAELSEHARALITASQEQAPPLASELAAIDAAVAEADAQAVAFAAALPDDLKPGAVARGLARTYAQARRARRRARKSERAIHRWRRRTKELAYQLVLLNDDSGAAEFRNQLLALDGSLGTVVDRLLLKDFVGLHGGALEAEAAGALLTHVHDQVLAGRDGARGDSKPLFNARPRKLRRRLRKALRRVGAPAVDHAAD